MHLSNRRLMKASDVLGYDMWDLIQQGEQEQINLTERTQPILLASSVAIWRLWNEHNGASAQPDGWPQFG